MTKKFFVTGLQASLLALTAITPSLARGGTILYTDFGPNMSYDSTISVLFGSYYTASYQDAMPFVASSSGPMGTITVPVYNLNGPNEMDFSLNADNDGQPGAALESWTLNNVALSQQFQVITSVLRPMLSAGTKYWLIASSSAGGEDFWYEANPGGPSGFKVSEDGGATWINATGSTTQGAFQIASARAAINGVSISGPNAVLKGSNIEMGTYHVLTSTNLALPLSQWTSVATNEFYTNGDFTITATNAVYAGVAQQFYTLQLQ